MATPETTLTTMRKTGKDIAAVFAHVLTEEEKSHIATQLLALMRSAPAGQELHSARLMMLGALAAVGREVQPLY